ncbi:lysophosphatidic acid acyltransferase / lysophosphatidylinositol acyltransferase [Pancytospora philotis]|nr:lysophosphatidic acid acyltransferase / lysophosphatidylinositol acyltransferase [Pancytospora philotis]
MAGVMQKMAKNVAIMVLCAPIIVFYLALLCVVLFVTQLLPSARLRLWITICCKRFAFHLVVVLLSHWFPNPVYVKYNKKILSARKTITISNHCSDYDWFFLLLLFHELGINDTRILLKKALGDIPVVGFLVRRFNHVCLNRARAKDMAIIKRAVQPLVDLPRYNLALYPEGTYLFPEAVRDARRFAQETKMEVDSKPFVPKLVLLPRKTGFNLITETLKDDYEGVIDVTIMMNPYVYMPCEDCPPFELFFNQKLVMNQFLIVDFVPRAQVTGDFLDRSFLRKEKRIKAYIDYADGAVDTEKKFLKTINKVDKPTANDETRTILVYTPYGSFILVLPIAIMVFSVFAAKGCLTALFQ